MNRLTERDFKFTSNYVAQRLQAFPMAQCLSKLQEYEDAEEQGLLVRLPCKVGDTVYTIYDNGEDKPQIETRKVFEVSTARVWLDSNRCYVSYDYFSKNIFPTMEAAKNALAEREQ